MTILDSGYGSTVEEIFTAHNPLVIEASTSFHRQALDYIPYDRLYDHNGPLGSRPSLSDAARISQYWYQFSDVIPSVLCDSATLMPNNEMRHYVIQTAYEELGMRDVREIHSRLFKETCEAVGLAPSEMPFRSEELREILNWLEERPKALQSAHAILGFILGLEIPAVENIKGLLYCLAYTQDTYEKLTSSHFFDLHIKLEPEHVRLTVSNFLRFCPEAHQQGEFQRGFDQGVRFWTLFWNSYLQGD